MEEKKKEPKYYSAAEFHEMFKDSGVIIQAWWNQLSKWRAQGRLVVNEDYVSMHPDPDNRNNVLCYLARPVLTLILEDAKTGRNHFCMTICRYYKPAIEKLLYGAKTPSTQTPSTTPKS